MKYRILAIALLILVLMLSVALSQVVFKDVLDSPAVKSNLASKTLFNDICFNGSRIVSVGQRGHIVYSDDQGESWSQSVVPISSDLTAVSFPTPKQGWAVGHDGVVLHSEDGGTNWVKQLDGRTVVQLIERYYNDNKMLDPRLLDEVKRHIAKGADKPFLNVWFENTNSGFVVGAFNLIFHTSDGGKSWEPWLNRTENTNGNHFYAIRPIGQDVYICGEQGLVLKLDKKSNHFRALKVPYNGTFFGITGTPSTLIAYGMRGNVFRSKDGGTSWQKVETGMQLGLIGSTVTPDGMIVLVSQAGHVLVSKDDGASFRQLQNEKPFPSAAIVATDKDKLVIAGLRGMQKQVLNK